MFNNILTVCTGNICRSPVAEALLRRELGKIGRNAHVQSAGIGALVGHPADPTTAEVALAHELPLDQHVARQIDITLTRWADLILVMEQHHLAHVLHIDPTARGKTFLLGHWNQCEIADPYKRGESAQLDAFRQIEAECGRWLTHL